MDFNEARNDKIAVALAGWYASLGQTTMTAPCHSIFTDWMLFLISNQQCESTDIIIKILCNERNGALSDWHTSCNYKIMTDQSKIFTKY